VPVHVADGAVTATFAKFMVQLAAHYPTTGKLSEATIRTYALALDGHTVDEIRSAVGRALGDGTLSNFFPSLPERMRLLRPSTDDAALIAWALFRRAAEDVGSYASLEVEDAAAGEALRLVFGSWPAYCAQEEGPALGARRQEFLAAYREAKRRLPPAPLPLRLQGLCESTGEYRGGPATVVGRLTAAGAVLTLPDATPVRSLPEHT
jgi:hypothetical protein